MIYLLFGFPLQLSQMPLHDLGIGFSGTFARCAASSLTVHLHTHTVDTWSHMFDGRELNLQLRFRRFRVELKNLENQIYSIPYLYFHLPFLDFLDDSIELTWLENISDDDGIDVHFRGKIQDFIELPFAHIGRIIRLITFLNGLEDNDSTIGRDEFLEFGYTVFEAKTGEQSGIFWSDIEEYGPHTFLG